MNIQINTGHNIKGNKALSTKFSSTIKSELIHFSDHITKVEVHMKDEPIVVTDHADNLNQALNGAIDKLISMIESILGRQRDQRNFKT